MRDYYFPVALLMFALSACSSGTQSANGEETEVEEANSSPLPELVPNELPPAPEVNSPEELPAFFEWFRILLADEVSEAIPIIEEFGARLDMVEAVKLYLDDYQENESARVAMNVLIVMPARESEDVLFNFAMRPVDGASGQASEYSSYSFEEEVVLRLNAAESLLERWTDSGDELALQVGLKHEEQLVRVKVLEAVLKKANDEDGRQIVALIREEDLPLIHPRYLPPRDLAHSAG